MNTDVLIVGAGPTGLMLANQLVRYGVRVCIIDRHPGPSLQTRALGVQARTLEIYAKLGIVERALELGKPGYGANMWANGRQTGHIPLGDAGKRLTPYPFIHVLGQDDNERLLGEKLRESGVAVQWNVELVALEQKSDHVVATLKGADGETQTVEAAWVAGCDGAHSMVRTLNGIDFPGAPYEHVFYVADIEARGSMVPDEVNVYLWEEGFHLFFPMRGKDHWRIVGIVPPAMRTGADVQLNDVMPALRAEAGLSLDINACSWFSTYRIHHRKAARFRNERCFLLGDAAHVHSPVGAQGMNTGLQDAYNLGWKLALVSRGRAHPALLDSYEEERIPVAQRLLDTTDRAFRLVVSDSRLAGVLRTAVVARIAGRAMRRERIQRAAFRTVSQIGIHYSKSSLSLASQPLPPEAPQPGDRFPWLHLKSAPHRAAEDLFRKLSDTHFSLLVFGAPAASVSDFGGLLATHVFAADADNTAELADAHIPCPSFYLLRPDGHIGLCGTRVDAAAIGSYMSERVQLTRTFDASRAEKTVALAR